MTKEEQEMLVMFKEEALAMFKEELFKRRDHFKEKRKTLQNKQAQLYTDGIVDALDLVTERFNLLETVLGIKKLPKRE